MVTRISRAILGGLQSDLPMLDWQNLPSGRLVRRVRPLRIRGELGTIPHRGCQLI